LYCYEIAKDFSNSAQFFALENHRARVMNASDRHNALVRGIVHPHDLSIDRVVGIDTSWRWPGEEQHELNTTMHTKRGVDRFHMVVHSVGGAMEQLRGTRHRLAREEQAEHVGLRWSEQIEKIGACRGNGSTAFKQFSERIQGTRIVARLCSGVRVGRMDCHDKISELQSVGLLNIESECSG
jgi:hypothetical protein